MNTTGEMTRMIDEIIKENKRLLARGEFTKYQANAVSIAVIVEQMNKSVKVQHDFITIS